MGRRIRARTGAAVGALLTAVAGCEGAPSGIQGVAGLWSGEVEQAGRRSVFALRLEAAGPDSAVVSVSMSAIGTYDLAVGKAAVERDRITLGGWSATFDAARTSLSGTIPSALAPVYQIPFTLERVEELPRAEPTPPAPPRDPRWTFQADAPIWAGVATGAQVVYAATDSGTVYALAEEEGSVRWSRRMGGGVRATPTVDGSALYVHADDGTVSRLDGRTGAVRWTAAVGAPADRIPPGQAGSRYDSYAAGVLRVADLAVVGAHEGAVVALDAASGAERWRVETDGSVLGTPTTDGSQVFYGTFEGDVGAVDAATGEPSWTVRTSGAVVSTPSVAGSLVIVGNRAYDLLALRVADGSTAWRFYYWFSWVESSVTVAGGTAFVGSSDAQRLYAIEAATGRELWGFATEGSTWATPAAAEGTVYVGTVGVADYITEHRARFHAVDAASGRPLWRFEMERPDGARAWGFASSPAVGARGVYVGGTDGRLYAF